MKKRIKIVDYGSNTLQKGGRIQLPHPLLNTLGMKEGQHISIQLDTENGWVILEPSHHASTKGKKGNLGELQS